MTNHPNPNSAAQAATNTTAQNVLTDDEINTACDWPAANTTMRAENDRAMAREVEAAVLRKLRAPVADERAAQSSNDEQAADTPIKAAYVAHFGHAAGWLSYKGSWFTEGFHAGRRAALASAVAGEAQHPTSPEVPYGWVCERYVGVSLDGQEMYSTPSFTRERPYSTDRTIVELYAAPQASAEKDAAVRTLTAKGYTWHGGEQWKPPLGDSNATQARLDASDALEVARAALMEIADLADVEADQRSVIVNQALTKIAKITATPQASAEDEEHRAALARITSVAKEIPDREAVHNAALEEAAQALDRLHAENRRWHNEFREGAAVVRALKQPQADKNRGTLPENWLTVLAELPPPDLRHHERYRAGWALGITDAIKALKAAATGEKSA